MNWRSTFTFLALLAALAVGLLFLLPGGSAQAQEARQSFTYAENGTGPVTTLTATDPEGVTPIVWSLLDSAEDEQNLGIYTDDDLDGMDDGNDDVEAGDIADRALFSISQSGVLTFNSPPDYEMPEDADGDNRYHVVVQASDGGSPSHFNWFKVTVNVTDVEEAGKLKKWTVDPDGAGPMDGGQELLQFQPFAVLTVKDPTDSDAPEGVTDLRWQWYRVFNKVDPGTAIPGATEETYTVSDTTGDNDVGMYLRVVATYSDDRGPNKTASFVSENPVQAARDDNTAPKFALTTETREIQENYKGNVGSPLMATDADNDILTYSIDGDSPFTIDRATGQLMTDGLNFEEPTAPNTSNVYTVKVKATDSLGDASNPPVSVDITVTDVNEPPEFETGVAGMAGNHQEDMTDLTVGEESYSATDPEGGNITLSLSGDDMDMFMLVEEDKLSFKTMPDFEMPADRNRDNIYEVTVQASDGELTTDRMVTVKVTDADEKGMVVLSSQDAVIGTTLMATITDSDGGAPDPGQFIDQVWTWHRQGSEGTGMDVEGMTAIDGAESSSYTPVISDKGMRLVAKVTYTDRTRNEDYAGKDPDDADAAMLYGFQNTIMSDATTRVRSNSVNQQPVFAAGASATRLVEENTMALSGDSDDDADTSDDNTADNVSGGPIEATDPDGDMPTYTLSGADASMFRVRALTGQIEVSDQAKLDYETKKTHNLTLTADDGRGESNSTASINVTIHVTDLDEKPMISDPADDAAVGEQQVDHPENSTGPIIQLEATDPEGVTPIVWSLLMNAAEEQDLGIYTDNDSDGMDDSNDDVDAGDIVDRELFSISQSGVLTFNSPPDYEEPKDKESTGDEDPAVAADNKYHVVVQASDGGASSHLNWFKVTVNVTNVEEAGELKGWTVYPDGDLAMDGVQNLLQFNANAALEADDPTDSDGDVANVQWQWSRSKTKSGVWTDIGTGGNEKTYHVKDTPESPNDVEYYLRVVATYTVDDGDQETASYVSTNKVQAVRQEENKDPVFSRETYPYPRKIYENTVGMVPGRVVAEDPDDGDILTYSLNTDTIVPGSPELHFKIDPATGELMVESGADLDYETLPEEPDGSKIIKLEVVATDSSGATDTTTVEVEILDVNEPPYWDSPNPNDDPPFMGMAADYSEDTENKTVGGSDLTFRAMDPELTSTVTLSLTGDDAGMFTLVKADPDDSSQAQEGYSGDWLIEFKEKPDFEMPGDRNRDNIYEVTVRASDSSSNTADKMVSVKVTDSEEEGMVSLSTQDAVVGKELMATLTDSDGGAPDPARLTDQVWTWFHVVKVAESESSEAIAGANSSSYTPVVGDLGKQLKAKVCYTDRTRDGDYVAAEDADSDSDDVSCASKGFMNEAMSEPTTVVRKDPGFNQAPEFKEGARAIRLVEENTMAVAGDDDAADDMADNVGGGPVTATDPDMDDVTYTLAGPDAGMFRVRDNGQIEVGKNAMLDYETMRVHIVEVHATDTSGTANNSGSITVEIHVTDLDEKPNIMVGGLAISGPGSANHVEGSMDTVATYTIVGSNADMASLMLEGDDAGDFMIQGGMLSFRSSPDYENPSDMDMDNMYMVTVKASDGTYMASHDVIVMVTNIEEMGTVMLTPAQPDMDNEVMASVNDPDGGVTGEMWQWARSMNMTDWMDIDGADMASYTPTSADEGYYLRAMVTYSDALGSDKSAVEMSEDMVSAAGTLFNRYDADGDGEISRAEAIQAINDYLFGVGEDSITKAEAIEIVNFYLFG